MPVITAPSKQRFVTNGVAVAVTATGASDSSMNFHVNGSSVGAMTNAGGGNWTFSWTPASAAASVSLTAVGNVSGTSAPVIVTVSAQNSIATDVTTWGSSWSARAVAAGITHPDGAGTVYSVIPFAAGSNNLAVGRALSPTPTTRESSFECWFGIAAANPLRCIQLNFGLGGGYFNFDTLETTAGDCYIWPMEQKTISGILWTRVQLLRTSGGSATLGYNMNISMCRNFTSNAPTITSGERPNCILYMASPFSVGDVVAPFTQHQKMSWHINAANTTAMATTNAEEINYKHPYMDTVANMAGGAYPSGAPYIRIIKPTGWVKGGAYPVIVVLPPLPENLQGSDPLSWDAAKSLITVANTNNALVVTPFARDGAYWWGERTASPERKGAKWLEEVLFQWLTEVYSASTETTDRLVVSYSKGPLAALGTKLLNPSWAGFFGFADGAWLNNYPSNQSDSDYNTAALYNARDPKQILAANKSAITAYKCITLQSGPTWSADHTSFTATLTSEGVPFDVITPAITTHRWGTAAVNGDWTRIMVEAMFAQRAAYLTPLSTSTMFFM
jgi:hypothetical protein